MKIHKFSSVAHVSEVPKLHENRETINSNLTKGVHTACPFTTVQPVKTEFL